VRDRGDRRVQHVVATDRAREAGAKFGTHLRRALDSLLTVLDENELRTYVEVSERLAAEEPASTQPVRRSA
jgi:DNA-binding MarR family transcriptional regulator